MPPDRINTYLVIIQNYRIVTNISPLVIKAYLETDYFVSEGTPFVFRVGVANGSIAKLYQKHTAFSGTFVTAFNPLSQNIDSALNTAKQAELAADLNRRGLTYFDGVGKHPTGNWPAEPGYFVLGLSLEAAKALGEKYDQNAIIWCNAGAIPELVLLR